MSANPDQTPPTEVPPHMSAEEWAISLDHVIQAVHSTRMEGGDIDAVGIERMLRVARGEITSAQARAEILTSFGIDPDEGNPQ